GCSGTERVQLSLQPTAGARTVVVGHRGAEVRAVVHAAEYPILLADLDPDEEVVVAFFAESPEELGLRTGEQTQAGPGAPRMNLPSVPLGAYSLAGEVLAPIALPAWLRDFPFPVLARCPRFDVTTLTFTSSRSGSLSAMLAVGPEEA